ncbi:MAG: LysM peptidoglycan-binding domain-containing protein [Ignavibacteria bacterium]
MKIEVTDNSGGDVAKRFEFPADCEYFGKNESQDVLKIFIRADALKRVDEYLASDINNELGGVLIGDVGLNSIGDKFILIDNLIIAKHTNSSISRLTFTHETWDYINQILEKDFPGKKILGWFHSHPGHTVFLSTYDMFIQENFFNVDHMVAYVYDPTINDRGFFSWANKKIIKSDGYYVCDIGKKEEKQNEFLTLDKDPELLDIETPDNTETKIRKSDYKNFVTIALLFLTLVLLLFIIYNIYDFKQKALLKEEYESDLAVIRNENKKLTDRLNEYILESDLKKKFTKSGDIQFQEEINSGPAGDKTGSTNLTANNSSINGSTNTESIHENGNITSTDPNVTITKYKVKSGDTLEKISNLFYKNREGIEMIMKQNNIKNKADIKIGQELDLPNVKQ